MPDRLMVPSERIGGSGIFAAPRPSPETPDGSRRAAAECTDANGPELSARDRRTIELRQFFRLPRSAGEERSYETRLWFYFPRGFGISPQTWAHDSFYRDASCFLRLHAPALRIEDLADLEHPTSPASALRRALPMLLEEVAPSSQSLDLLAKTLGAELADAATIATRDFATRLRDTVIVGDEATALVDELHTLCTNTLRALAAVRRLRAKARAYRTVAPTALLPSLAFAEEYASAVIEERLSELARVVDELPHLRDGRGTAVKLRLILARAAEEVVRRRIEQGFPIPSGEAPEYFTYRHGLLKKELQRALYVDTRASTRDPFFRNSAAMVAAGLAATWATLAQVPMLSGGLTTGQYGLFLGAAVGAYILKDRIKEWVRGALSKKLLRWDHDRHIVGDALAPAGLGSFGGRAQERVRWIDPDEVPREIASLRAKHRTVRGVNPELEHVLEYTRVVKLEGGVKPMPDAYGVQELFRLSLDEILKRLDDPVDVVSYYDPAFACFKKADMPKVYHLNLIASCTDDAAGTSTATRWRVVVNQEGILHIDVVARRVRDNTTRAPMPTTEVSLPHVTP